MDKRTTPFLIRLRPETRALLDRAAEDQRRSRASLVDEAVKAHLEARYGNLDTRIERFLMGSKQ